MRAALLPSVWAGLSAYALDHDGSFPDGNPDPYQALAELYPTYCTAADLAGVSGRIRDVQVTLEHHAPLTESMTDWMYFPGFRNTDPDGLAILWGRTSGYYWNGRRSFFGGRPVLFANGAISNVPADAWVAFLKSQEQLRRSIQSARGKPASKAQLK